MAKFHNNLSKNTLNDIATPEKTGKIYFKNRKFKHVSADHGDLHGTIACDLAKAE